MHQKLAGSFDEMTNLSKSLREKLAEEHAEIYEAISARDASKAKAFTFSHIENQRKAIIRSINDSTNKV